MDERSGLVEMRAAEADTHHDGGERDSAFEHRARLVELHDVLPPLLVLRLPAQLVDQRRQDVVRDRLSIVRAIAPWRVEIVPAHLERIEVEMVRNIKNRALDPDCPLR